MPEPPSVNPPTTAEPSEPPRGRVIRRRSGPAEDRGERGVMIPERGRRPAPEAFLMRLVATAGIVGIGTAIDAIMASQHSQSWLIGIVVSAVSVLLAAILWSSRRL
jgi:hypothetical protein